MEEAGLREAEGAVSAVGALLKYIDETQKFDISHVSHLDIFRGGKYMEMDWTTRRNLELTEALRSGEKRGSLLWVLDKTKTPMGSRLLRSWVERPLLSAVAIRRRLAAVDELVGDNVRRSELIVKLKEISDMQRLVGRCVYGTAGGRDLRTLANCCAALPGIKEILTGFTCMELKDIGAMDILEDIRGSIDAAICDEPPFSVREGGIIRTGYSKELDDLRNVRDNGAQMVKALEERERERTGIKKLKVGYNKVFGYYIDIPRSAGEVDIPADYIRKQTLVSNERYFTQELKELENTLLTSRERINELEYNYFAAIRDRVASDVSRIQATSDAVARLDALCSLAETAVRNHYTMPEIDNSGTISIVEGRHPVVEQTLKDVLFVPNDTFLNGKDDRVAIVTGPNMAGKSTYMRQTALIVLLAQIGSFVPASSAHIGIVDRIFTRIGASDDISLGQSTFMVEMNEVSGILRNGTYRSLLLLDEVGRGTSTYDGLAIAWSIIEFVANRSIMFARTIFATHYHELNQLESTLPGIFNAHVEVEEKNKEVKFLHKISGGGTSDSYGIEVARLAGVPAEVVDRARVILAELDKKKIALTYQAEEGGELPMEGQIPIFSAPGSSAHTDSIRTELRDLDISRLTPLEAMNILYSFIEKAKGTE